MKMFLCSVFLSLWVWTVDCDRGISCSYSFVLFYVVVVVVFVVLYSNKIYPDKTSS